MVMQRYFIVVLMFVFSALPILILFFRQQKKVYYNELSAIKPFLWLMFIGAIYEIIFSAILRVPVAYWFTIYTFLEFIMLWYFFYKLFNGYNVYLKVSLALNLAILALVLYYWEYEKHTQMEGYLAIPISIFIFTSSILWFKQLSERKDIISLFQAPSFYFISGLVIYFAGGLFVSLIIYQLKLITGFYEKYWLLFAVLSYVMRIIVAVGVWKATEKK